MFADILGKHALSKSEKVKGNQVLFINKQLNKTKANKSKH